MNKENKKLLNDLAEKLGISSAWLYDANVQAGLEDYLAGYSKRMLSLVEGDNPNDYKDLLEFLATPLKRMSKDELIAHLSCRKECAELMLLQGEINSRAESKDTSNIMTDEEFAKYASTLEVLVERISKVPQYAAWAREMQKAISEALLKNGRE